MHTAVNDGGRGRVNYRLVVAGGLALVMTISMAAGATHGTELIGIGALQKGTGGAGVASPKDMTWVLMNPASIIDMGCRLDVNVELFAPDRSLHTHGLFSNPFAGDMSDDSVFLIPSMGYSRACGCGEEAWGVGLYGVSGMGVEYSGSRSLLPKLFLRNYDRQTEYSVAKLAVGYTHTVGSSDWTIGIAPILVYSRFKTDMLTLRFAQTRADNDWDDAFGVGASIGVYRRWDRWGFGAAYTSRQWMTEFNDYDDLFFESMDQPQTFQVGFVWDINHSLELVADYKWINWSGIDQMGKSPLDGGFGWKDQHIFKLGLTWYVNPKWTVRGGVSYGKSPIREDEVFANALFPAVTETHVAAGFSYAVTEKSEVHFTYMHAFENELEDSGKGDLFSILGRGTDISLTEDTFTFEYSYKFQLGSCASRRLEWKREQYEQKKGPGRF